MKTLRKPLFPVLCVLLVLLISAPLWVLPVVGAFLPRNSHENDYTAAIVDKYDRLNAAEGKKIVFVGGSSLPFGLRCDLVESEMPGYSAVDFGLYATLGTVVMMDLSLSGIGEGDLVILAPETDPQLYSDYFTPRLLRASVGDRTDLLKSLSPARRRETALVYYPSLFDRVRRRNDPLVPETELYARSSFDEYGDIAVTRERNQMVRGYDASNPVSLSALNNQEFFDEVNAYAKKVRERGATLLFWFPPINQAAVNFTDKEAERFLARLETKLDVPLLGSVAETVYDSAYFFDTNYHLNDAGAMMHTAKTLLKLKAYLGMEETVGFEIPDPPAEEEKDDLIRSDGTFLYECTAWSAALVGVEESVKGTLTTVTVPATVTVPDESSEEPKDKVLPVKQIADGCFADCKNLTSVTLHDKIMGLGYGVFAGCEKLTEIRILGSSPFTIPESGAFDGASPALRIRIPRGTTSAFDNAYSGWGKYSSLFEEFDP